MYRIQVDWCRGIQCRLAIINDFTAFVHSETVCLEKNCCQNFITEIAEERTLTTANTNWSIRMVPVLMSADY